MFLVVSTLLTALIDPLLWFKTMSALGCKRSSMGNTFGYLGCYIIVVTKQFVESYVENSILNFILSIILVAYLVVATLLLFEGDIYKKIIKNGIFFFMIFVTEMLSVGIFTMYLGVPVSKILESNVINLICTLLSKSLLAVSCYFYFLKENVLNSFYRNREVLSLALFNVIVEMPVGAIIKSTHVNTEVQALLFFGIVQIMLVWSIFYVSKVISKVIRKKNKYIDELENEIEMNPERKEWITKASNLRHDIDVHVSIINNLVYYKQYDKLLNYTNSAFQDVGKIELLYNHPNVTFAILISQLKKKACDLYIKLYVLVQVKNFHMNDNDICSIVHNIVMNAFEAVQKVQNELSHVTLQILDNEYGYQIICINESNEVVDYTVTSKEDKNNHGFGVGIVTSIVKKHNGSIRMETKTTECEGIYVFTVTILIPIKEKYIARENDRSMLHS